MSIKELNRYAGRKREFPKEAKSIAEKFNTKNQTILNYNYIQQNLKFIKKLKKLANSFKSKNTKNTNKNFKQPQLSNINKSLQNLNTKDFARNIKFKSIFSVTNLKRKKKNKVKNKNKIKKK